jgi:hypothetical protein
MTQPGGGHGNDINLAALWIPVMPETSHMGEEMRKAGQESKRKFEEGFNSGTSPEAMGGNFTSKLSSTISQGLSKIELPLGLNKAIDQLSGDIDTKLIAKVQGEAAQALSKYRTEYENLTQTLGAHTEAQNRLNTARDNGINKASIVLPLIQEESRAHAAVNEQLPKTNAAYGEYTNKSQAAAEATKSMATGSSLLAGAIGGLSVVAAAGVAKAVEGLAEAGIEGFKKSIELAGEFADKMVEIGETYEHLGIQITEFSSATGTQFEELEAHAQKVFGSLDVAGKNTGQTMAQFAAILDAEPSAALDRLTQHTEELQGRYNSLKATDLASIFYAFKTPAEEADSSLASLLQSARNSGQDLGQLSSALSGDVSYTLQEAGLNLEQAGAFTGKLMEMGTSGRSVIMGLNTAMKEFGKEGLSFSDGMKLAAARLNELGGGPEGQALSEKLFGTRRWAVAKAAVEEYLNIVKAGPDAFNSSGAAVDDFVEKTRTLQNEWEIVKHKAEEAFLPMGLEAVHLAGAGIDALAKYIDTHMDGIKKTIRGGGDFIIEFAASTQNMAIALLEFFAPVVDAIDAVFGEALKGMGLFVQAEGEILSHIPGFTDMGNSLIDVGKNAQEFGGKLENVHVGDKMKDVAQWLKDHKIDVDKAKDSWDTYADHVSDATQKAADSVETSGGAIGMGLGRGAGEGGIAAPGGGWSGGGGGFGGGESGGGATGFGGRTGSGDVQASGGGQGLGGGQQANRALAHQLFPWGQDEWDAFEKLEMKEAGFDSTARNPDSGAFGMGQFLGHEKDQYASGYSTDPATQLKTMYQYIRDRYGTPSNAWAQYYQHPGGQGYYQHGGPVAEAAISGSGQKGHGKWRPNGPLDLWGTTGGGWQTGTSGWFGGPTVDLKIPGGHTLNSGAPHYFMGPDWDAILGKRKYGTGSLVTGGSGGVDDIPAMLTRGEYVWDTDTVDKHGWLISALHQGAKGFDQGGAADTLDMAILRGVPSGHYADPGEKRDDLSKGLADCSSAIEALVNHLEGRGLTAPSGMFTGNEAQWLQSHGFVPGEGGPGDFRVGFNSHHTQATLPGGTPFNWGSEQAAQNRGIGGTGADDPAFTSHYYMPLGQAGDLQYPGLPGQYGGSGVYGGETYDQQRSAEKAVQDAKDRAADMDHSIAQQQKKIEDIKAQIGKVGVSDKTGELTGKPLPLTPDEQRAADDKRKQLNDQLDEATYQLGKSQRERSQQNDNISDAERKQQESMYKKPSGTSGSQQVPKAVGAQEFQQLGSSLLGGIGQELGFGDLFAKPPWEWGAVKLLTGAASWAMGTANAWADEIGKGHTGMTGFQPIEGWDQQGGGPAGSGGMLSGLSGSLGLTLPKASGVSSGPNIVATQPPGPFGAPAGPLPGPAQVVQGDYMPINVTAGVDPSTIMAPVHEQRNAQNSTLHGFTGGLPQ